jgi:hypothetical protein
MNGSTLALRYDFRFWILDFRLNTELFFRFRIARPWFFTNLKSAQPKADQSFG